VTTPRAGRAGMLPSPLAVMILSVSAAVPPKSYDSRAATGDDFEAHGRSGMANVKRRNIPDPIVVPRLYKTVGSTPLEEIKPLREIRKLGYEYFWVKMSRAWPWLIGLDSNNGKTFFINTTEFNYAKYRDRPVVGLLPPPAPKKEYWGREEKNARRTQARDTGILPG
jgi:hypothetical protein